MNPDVVSMVAGRGQDAAAAAVQTFEVYRRERKMTHSVSAARTMTTSPTTTMTSLRVVMTSGPRTSDRNCNTHCNSDVYLEIRKGRFPGGGYISGVYIFKRVQNLA